MIPSKTDLLHILEFHSTILPQLPVKRLTEAELKEEEKKEEKKRVRQNDEYNVVINKYTELLAYVASNYFKSNKKLVWSDIINPNTNAEVESNRNRNNLVARYKSLTSEIKTTLLEIERNRVSLDPRSWDNGIHNYKEYRRPDGKKGYEWRDQLSLVTKNHTTTFNSSQFEEKQLLKRKIFESISDYDNKTNHKYAFNFHRLMSIIKGFLNDEAEKVDNVKREKEKSDKMATTLKN